MCFLLFRAQMPVEDSEINEALKSDTFVRTLSVLVSHL